MQNHQENDMKEHEVYMRLALDEARQALAAGDLPVGCIIVQAGAVVATGRRRNSAGMANELDHAEIVAVRSLLADRPGTDLSQVTVYSTMEPCLMCFATMLVNNIEKIVFGYEDVMGGGTNIPLAALAPLYAAKQIDITHSVLRAECLALFQQFFRDRPNGYLHDTLLARSTLMAS